MDGLGNISLSVIWTEPALADLDRADYIALDKPDAAKRLVHRVFESVKRLTIFPKSGSCPKELHGTFNDKLRIVTPGVRPTWAATEDQKRVMTPAEAFKAGSE
jgi:plasmid stabilization system protein ParE